MEIGAIKIKDGFFIGDVYAARDIEFVILNKITRVINCAAAEVPNIFAVQGVLYYSFAWVDAPDEDYLRDREALNEAIEFLNQSIELGESVLIHSVRCQNRALFMCACYLVRQYELQETQVPTAVNFIYSRKLIPRMRVELERQLKEYEQWEKRPNQCKKCVSAELRVIVWSPEHVRRCIGGYTPEEVILANTFLNTYIEPNVRSTEAKRPSGTRLQWNDRPIGGRISNFKNKLCTSFVPSYEHLQFRQLDGSQLTYKPILKRAGCEFEVKQKTQNLMEPNNSVPPGLLGVRASSANNFHRSSSKQIQLHKKPKINRSGSDKDFENDFPQGINLAKRNTLDPNLLIRNKRQSLNRSTSKDRKLENLLASSKAKLNAFYSNLNCYSSYKGEKQRTSKPMKKMASTKMIRPQSGQSSYSGSLGLAQGRSFMEGASRFQDTFEK